jgi:hypothetical protein
MGLAVFGALKEDCALPAPPMVSDAQLAVHLSPQEK